MQAYKKTIKLFGLALLIVLACFGIGIGGGVPISPNNKRENSNEVKTEIVEIKTDKIKLNEVQNFKQ